MKSTISKRRAIEKMKSSASIKGDRVDEALDELDEVRLFLVRVYSNCTDSVIPQATKHEKLLAARLAAISTNLQPSLQSHSRAAHQDLLTSLLDHARSSLLYEKQLLKELELVRPELAGIKKPQAGVYYHTMPASPTPNMRQPPAPLGAGSQGGSPTMQRTSSLTSQRPSSAPISSFGDSAPAQSAATSAGVGPSSRAVGRGAPDFAAQGPLGGALGSDQSGSMAKKVQQRTVRSMASSVVVEGDRRQRVDVSFDRAEATTDGG